MSDELALRKDMERAAQAGVILDNPIIAEAFVQLEADYIQGWKDTPARDTEGREKLWMAVQIVGKVKSHLQNVVASGSLARAEIEQIAPKPKRFGIV